MNIDNERVLTARVPVFYDEFDDVFSLVERKKKGYTKTLIYNHENKSVAICGLAKGGEGKLRIVSFSPFGTHVTTISHEEYGVKFSVFKYDLIFIEDSFFLERDNVIIFDLEKGEGYLAGIKGVSTHLRLYNLVISGEEVRVPFFDYNKKYVFLRVK